MSLLYKWSDMNERAQKWSFLIRWPDSSWGAICSCLCYTCDRGTLELPLPPLIEPMRWVNWEPVRLPPWWLLLARAAINAGGGGGGSVGGIEGWMSEVCRDCNSSPSGWGWWWPRWAWWRSCCCWWWWCAASRCCGVEFSELLPFIEPPSWLRLGDFMGSALPPPPPPPPKPIIGPLGPCWSPPPPLPPPPV